MAQWLRLKLSTEIRADAGWEALAILAVLCAGAVLGVQP